MNNHVDIYKAGGILIRDRKFLISRSHGKKHFYAPGGKLEQGETPKQALIRELQEELGISVDENELTAFGTFYARVAGDETKSIRMDVFMVNAWKGQIQPQSEIAELMWIDSSPSRNIQIGSIFGHEVLPRLKELHLID